MTLVIVTGGSGKLGRACVKDLLDHGYNVVNADVAPPAVDLCPFVQVNLTGLDRTIELLSGMEWYHNRGVDAVVHLAAVPMPGVVAISEVFGINTASTYNVFEASRRLGIRNVVWASSETLLGLPYKDPPPYLPVDEDYPARPETAYSLSKAVGEEIARQFCRWDPLLKIACLRFSNVMDPAEYAQFPSFDPEDRKFNLFGYIDARDGAQAIRLSLEADIKGAEVFVIANSDTVSPTSSAELAQKYFPGVPFKRKISGHETLLSIDKARRVLGYSPKHSWRPAQK
ncbi:NAD-dependent epimerase/dehydratase family protein [Bradyrhizobium sp. CCBAU 51627]|uniref:NAD-dependent epimerase/dehydratase family protein n=1 Tax=Bradyrhizobium sp. CCBAU 51627 TaxID=1325088 RepID=UPI0023064636|nr:NAD(P)-dependent oxidoreductase [Bradyrhizobium sp. CCBAU 51627]MDA9433668.1 UDP-glucose 4-epimerase [Bradyrhizobium sp. CCBAU 51627]